MSAIASFHLVRNEDVARLKELAARPAGPGAAGKWHDAFWEFLTSNARELEPYHWSGYVLGSEVYFYLQSRATDMSEYCDKVISDDLSNARQTSIYVFRSQAAREFADLIAANQPDEASLIAFLNSPDMIPPNGETVTIEAVYDGLRILERWLSQVDEFSVGLLSIG